MSTSALETLITQYHDALDQFMTGNAEPLKQLCSRREGVTLGNPFGPFAQGWENVASTMERAALNYRDGHAEGFERIGEASTDELAYIVEVERFSAKVGGASEPAYLALRCTSVFRIEDGEWRVVHRHADPITSPRPPESLLE